MTHTITTRQVFFCSLTLALTAAAAAQDQCLISLPVIPGLGITYAHNEQGQTVPTSTNATFPASPSSLSKLSLLDRADLSQCLPSAPGVLLTHLDAPALTHMAFLQTSSHPWQPAALPAVHISAAAPAGTPAVPTPGSAMILVLSAASLIRRSRR